MNSEKLDRLASVSDAFPITAITRYGNGCYRVHRECLLQQKPNRGVARGKVKKLSNDSLSRLIVVIQSSDITFHSMITLTYPKQYPLDGEIVKADIHTFTQWVRKRFNTHFLWFLEFQERGAPHVHLMLETSEITPRMRVDAGLYWTKRLAMSGWMQEQTKGDYDKMRIAVIRMAKFNTHQSFWELIRHTDAARRYVTKYAAKSFQKDVPKAYQKVGRFWGCSKGVAKPGVTIDVTDQEVRDYLDEHNHACGSWELIPKYLFNVKDDKNGKVEPSGN